jgi:hypothetical protein
MEKFKESSVELTLLFAVELNVFFVYCLMQLRIKRCFRFREGCEVRISVLTPPLSTYTKCN